MSALLMLMSSEPLEVLESLLFDKELSFTIEEKNWISEASPCRTFIKLKCKSSSHGFQIKKDDENTNATEISTSINIYENTLKQADDVIGYLRFWKGAGKESAYFYPAYIESRIAVQSEFFRNLYKALFQDKAIINIVCKIKNLRDTDDLWDIEKTPDLLVRNLLISQRGDSCQQEESSDKELEVFEKEGMIFNEVGEKRENNGLIWFIGRRAIQLIKRLF